MCIRDRTKEGHILDRGRSNQPWPAGAEAETDEAEAAETAPHLQLVAKLTNTNPTVSQLFTQKRAASSIGVAQISLGQLELRLRIMRLTLMMLQHIFSWQEALCLRSPPWERRL